MITTADLTATTGTAAVVAARFLTPVVRSAQALTLTVKQAHWNVRGANFIAIHELLDDVAAHAREAADLGAERIVSMGLAVDARLQAVSKMIPTTAVKGGFSSWEDTVRDVVSDIDDTITTVDRAITELEGDDRPGQDIAIGIKAVLERDRWLLSAHLPY